MRLEEVEVESANYDEKVWRLLDTGHLTAAENMALDETLLSARASGQKVNTFRILQFNPSCVLVGYHQCTEREVRLDYCVERNFDVNRRITGGGAIFFQPDHVGWEVVAGRDSVNIPSNVEELYAQLSQGAVNALRSLGIHGNFRPKNDIEVNGKKISGTGGTELENAILFQGTLLTILDVDSMLRALRIPTKKLSDKGILSMRDRVTTVEWELGRRVETSTIKHALEDGFSKALNVKFIHGSLTKLEEELYANKLPKFKSEAWIFGEKRPFKEASEVYASRKTPGGLIHVAIAVDQGIIKNILITGDFFAYPRECIPNLEAKLKFTPCNLQSVEKEVAGFFDGDKPRVLGVEMPTLLRVLGEALEKINYVNLGLEPVEINRVYVVNISLQDALDRGFDTILVPYCCKDLECGFRNLDDCLICGNCDASALYEYGEKNQVRVITVVNYEHLEEVLDELDKKGSIGYIGACCEQFYEKHQPDFEAHKTPGVLVEIDSTSCYELGLEKVAYLGRFENQTKLNLALLFKLLKNSKKPG